MTQLDRSIAELKREVNQQEENAVSPSQSEGLNYLEHLTAKREEKCSNPKCPTLRAKDKKAKEAMFIRTYCKKWDCPSCGARNALRWIARMLHSTTILDGLWSFVTFTAHRKWRKEASLKNIKTNWSKLRKRYMRAVPEGTHYIWVIEMHQDNSYHVHMLTNWQLPTKWWKDNSAECGMGYQSKSVNLDNVGQAAGYMAKYLGKQLAMGKQWPKNIRRITTSQGFPELPKMSTIPDSFEFEPMYDTAHIKLEADYLRKIGYHVSGEDYVIRMIDKYKTGVIE